MIEDIQRQQNISTTRDRERESIPPLSAEVALLKLEQKFRRAMQDNVELSSEKEQLEHLVVQLQEETDTIGKDTLTKVQKTGRHQDCVSIHGPNPTQLLLQIPNSITLLFQENILPSININGNSRSVI